MTIKFVNSLAEFHALPWASEVVFCDTETDGLYGEVRLLQLYQSTWESPVIIDFATYDGDKEPILESLANKHLAFHNSSYDLYVLNINPEKFEDTMYLARIKLPHLAVEDDAESKGFGLDKIVYYLRFTDLYANLDKKAMQKANYSMEAELSLDQYIYAATDVIALSKIYPILATEDVITNTSYLVDKLSTIYANKYCRNGISVNKEMVQEELVKVTQAIEDNVGKLNGLNVNSPKQCKEALGTDSTDRSTLLGLIAQGNELAKLIFDQRRLMKRKVMLESYNFDKVYSVFKVAGAATGRFTATGKGIPQGINSQQIPRDAKKFFYNPSKDFVTIEADYSTLELRLAAAIFGDENMAQKLRDGLDLHTTLAAELAGKDNLDDVTKEERFRAKAVNFGFVYGMSAPSFRDYAFDNYGLNLSQAEAKEWRDTYFRLYPTIAKYHDNVWKNYKATWFVQKTALGKPVKPRLGTDAINAPVQGSGAECTKLAIHFMLKEKPEYINYIANVVHDSIKLEVPIAIEKEACELLEKSMIKGWEELLSTRKTLLSRGDNSVILIDDIPMKVDIEVKRGEK